MNGEWRGGEWQVEWRSEMLSPRVRTYSSSKKNLVFVSRGYTLSELNENDVVGEKLRLMDRYGSNESYQTPCDDSRLGSGRCAVVAAWSLYFCY